MAPAPARGDLQRDFDVESALRELRQLDSTLQQSSTQQRSEVARAALEEFKWREPLQTFVRTVVEV